MNPQTIQSLIVLFFLATGLFANGNSKDTLTTLTNKPLRTYTTD